MSKFANAASEPEKAALIQAHTETVTELYEVRDQLDRFRARARLSGRWSVADRGRLTGLHERWKYLEARQGELQRQLGYAPEPGPGLDALREQAARLQTEIEQTISAEAEGALRRSLRAQPPKSPAVLGDGMCVEPRDLGEPVHVWEKEEPVAHRPEPAKEPQLSPAWSAMAEKVDRETWREERLTTDDWRPVPRHADGTPALTGDYARDRRLDPERDGDVIWEPMEAWDEAAYDEGDEIGLVNEQQAFALRRAGHWAFWTLVRSSAALLLTAVTLSILSPPFKLTWLMIWLLLVMNGAIQAVYTARHYRDRGPKDPPRSYHGPGPVPGTVGDPLNPGTERELKMYGEPTPEAKAELPEQPWFGEPTRGYRASTGGGALAHAAMHAEAAYLAYSGVPPLLLDLGLVRRNRR